MSDGDDEANKETPETSTELEHVMDKFRRKVMRPMYHPQKNSEFKTNATNYFIHNDNECRPHAAVTLTYSASSTLSSLSSALKHGLLCARAC